MDQRGCWQTLLYVFGRNPKPLATVDIGTYKSCIALITNYSTNWPVACIAVTIAFALGDICPHIKLSS